MDRGLGRRPPTTAIVPLDPAVQRTFKKITRLLGFADIHPPDADKGWQFDEHYMQAWQEEYERKMDVPEVARKVQLRIAMHAATVISAWVRGYLARRAYLGGYLYPRARPTEREAQFDAQEAPPPAIDARLVGRMVWVLCPEEESPEHYAGDFWIQGKITEYYTPEEAQTAVKHIPPFLHIQEDDDLQDAVAKMQWQDAVACFNEQWPLEDALTVDFSDDVADWKMLLWLHLDNYDPYVHVSRPADWAWYLEEAAPAGESSGESGGESGAESGGESGAESSGEMSDSD